MKLLVTGGAGFIGSCFILQRIENGDQVVNLDKLTYSGNPENLEKIKDSPAYTLVKGDICNQELVKEILFSFEPDAIINFAAESHVDRSVINPDVFVQTNVVGTSCLLESSREFWKSRRRQNRTFFRFHHISTDEVYGSLSLTQAPFSETSPYKPSSPYAASKAGSDLLVRAFHTTFGLPTLITNCSNNYGPRQFPEKLIPLMIINALSNKELPVYGNGQNIRDWLHVEDHCNAISLVLEKAEPGKSYNIGGNCEKTNLEVLDTLIRVLDEVQPRKDHRSYREQIKFVKDRPGHDFRYAIDSGKIKRDLGWSPRFSFEDGIKNTVDWYLSNMKWVNNVLQGSYRDWIKQNYEDRNI